MFKILLLMALALALGCQSSQTDLEPVLAEVQIKPPSLIPPVALNTENLVERVAFGSRIYQKLPQPVWKAILLKEPDLFLAMGDNIQALEAYDRPMAEAFRLQINQTEFANFRALVPMLGTWNEADAQGSEAKRIFLDMFPNVRNFVDPAGGLNHSVVLGHLGRRTHIIILDTTSFRSQFDLLGQAQWRWLEAELTKAAEVRIIVSALPLQTGKLSWLSFQKSRQQLFAKLKTSSTKNLLILTGGGSCAEFNKFKSDQQTLIEVSSSCLNTLYEGPVPSKNPNRLGHIYEKENFGLLEINWDKKIIRTNLYNLHGESLGQYDLSFR